MIRVLLADDNTQFRQILRRLLERDAQIEVVAEAANGVEAITRSSEVSPDVVIMDVSMPGMDGIEATNEIKTRQPGVTVLMLSIGNKQPEIEAGLAGGASEYLVKGSSADEIVEAIKRYGPVAHSV